MSHIPAVSVVMPVYNTPVPYLKEAVESVLNQTFKDFELIIVNDGSTKEETNTFLKALKDKRIMKHKFKNNRGISVAKNTGIDIARGKYVAIMDSDDISSALRVKKQFEFMEKHPEVLMCGTDCMVAGNVNWPKYFYSKPAQLKERIFFRNCFTSSSTMFRRDAVKALNIQYPPIFAEDYAFNYQCSKHGKVYNLPEELVVYRVHASSISRLFASKNERPSNVQVYQYILNDFLCMQVPLKYVKMHITLVYFLEVPTPREWLHLVCWVFILLRHPKTSIWQKGHAVYLLLRDMLKTIKRGIEKALGRRLWVGR